MTKFPLTTVGLQNLLASIYSQDDTAVQSISNQIRTNFKNFIIENFELEESQIDYLDSLDERFILLAAGDSAEFVASRKNIELIKDPLNRIGGEGEGKILDLSKKTNASYSHEKGFTEEESLTFHISYQ